MSAPTMEWIRIDTTTRCEFVHIRNKRQRHRRCLVTNKLLSFFFISRILSVPKKELQKSVQVFK